MHTQKIVAPQFRRKLLDKSANGQVVHGGNDDGKRALTKDVTMASEKNTRQRFWYPGDIVLPEERTPPDLAGLKKGGVTDHRNIPVFVRGKKFTNP